MGYTLLDINISKQTDFIHRRKVAWLRSDRKYQLSEGVYASLPYYFLEGEVHSNIRKVAKRAKELGYEALIFGERCETQVKCAQWNASVFETFSKEGVDIILKLTFENRLLELLESRKYLVDSNLRKTLVGLLRKIPLPPVKGLYWELSTIHASLLQSPQFRKWTIQELLTEEVRLFEEAFKGIPLLFAECSEFLGIGEGTRTIAVCSSYEGKPWEEYRSKKPLTSKAGYRHAMTMHNRGMLMMGEGLWPIQNCTSTPDAQELCWGDCDLYAQFPVDDRFAKDWGILGVEARLLLLKMLQAKEKSLHKIQFEAWSFHLKELELRAEENPLLRHFIADAWYFLYGLQAQPIPQGICQGGYWRGKSLTQEPHPDGSPWFAASRMFIT